MLQGHDHTVARTFPINKDGTPQAETTETVDGVEYSVNPKGVFYIQSGTSGGQTGKPYHVNDTNCHLYSYTGKSYTSMWTEFAIDGNTMKVTVKYYENSQVKTYQTWGIKKTAN